MREAPVKAGDTEQPANVFPINGAVAVRAVPTPGPPGWHGLTARPQGKYRPEDWAKWDANWASFGDGACLVDVANGSPASRNDLRSGAWVISINGRSLREFEHSGGGVVGQVIEVMAFIDGFGIFPRKFALTEKPTKKSRRPAWKDTVPVPPGERAPREKRYAWLELARAHPQVRRHVWFLETLVLKFEGRKGIFPKHETITLTNKCSRSAVQRAQACCQHFGFIRINSGKHFGRANTYEPTFPSNDVVRRRS